MQKTAKSLPTTKKAVYAHAPTALWSKNSMKKYTEKSQRLTYNQYPYILHLISVRSATCLILYRMPAASPDGVPHLCSASIVGTGCSLEPMR